MAGLRTRLVAALVTALLCTTGVALTTGGPAGAVVPPPQQLTFSKTISSLPWPTGTLTGVNANDIEGLVYVPSNNSIWVADDNRDRIFEIDAVTGALKSQITKADFQAAGLQVGSGQLCSDPAQLDPAITGDTAAFECLSRTDDFESIVYNPVADVLYVTSGGCCAAGLPAGYPKNPTVWELQRSGSTFVPARWQALPETEDPTAAGWRPTDGMYYGKNNFIRSYDFATNALGTKITAPGYLVGVDFTDASTVYLTTATPNVAVGRTTDTSDSTITQYTFSGTSFTPVSGMSFPLQGTGVIDARDLAIGPLGTFFVSDGYDSRTGAEFNGTGKAGDHPIYVFAPPTAATLPTAAFTAVQQPSVSGYPVQFTSTGTPGPTITAPVTTWAWDFGDGTTSNLVSPLHTYSAVGTYTVTLTVTNAAGSSVPAASQQVTVSGGVVPPGPNWRYESLAGSGSHLPAPAHDHFGGGNTLVRYGSTLHDFYRNTTGSHLDHSWWDGTQWKYEVLDASGGSVGTNIASLIYGGQIQLYYTDSTGTHLTHRWWDGIAWHSEAFDPGISAGSGTIAVKQYGTQLQLFYANDTTHHLRHAWWNGTNWGFEDLDTGTALPASNTSVDASKYGATLQVVYKTSGNALRHSWYDNGWHSETLDGSGSGYAGHTGNSVGDYAQLQSFNKQLDVLYRDATAGGLRHAWWNGTKWSFELLDGNGGNIPGHTNNSVGGYIQAMLYGGGLHVWYRDLTSGALRHAWYAGGWHVEILDGVGTPYSGASNSGNTGVNISLTDFGGQIQLTYFDPGTADRLAHTWYG